MTSALYFAVSLSIFVAGVSDAQPRKCQENESIIFEKVVGYRLVSRNPGYLFRDGEIPLGNGTVVERCIEKCRKSEKCYAVVIQPNGACTGLEYNKTITLKADNDMSTFIKACAKVPPNCKKKHWNLERSPGYNLIAPDSVMIFMDNVTYEDCLRRLFLKQDGTSPRSGQFIDYSSKVNYMPNGNEIIMSTAVGSCMLNSENKYTEPESYRVTNFDSYYIENQCLDDFPRKIDRCSYEEYYNQTLKHYDRMLPNLSSVGCKEKCESEEKFMCRGFTTVTLQGKSGSDAMNSTVRDKTCYLHSEDVLTLGSWLITKKLNAIYYRRVTCLNMTVDCKSDSMIVKYYPRTPFRGRIYVSGRAEKCGAEAVANGPTVLTIGFNGNCNLNSAYAIGGKDGINRTLLYAMVVVQNNPIVQAQGDRFVRVGCVVGGTSMFNLSASIELGTESDVDPIGPSSIGELPPASALFNTTTDFPRIVMYIVDDPQDPSLVAGQHPGASGAVALGESLELRIEVTPDKNDPIDISAYHLIASSQMGDSSILLLDNQGCPTGQVDFPQFRRISENGTVRLYARFKAFRFPSSNVVKFNVMVQFCKELCKEVICIKSYKKSRPERSVNNLNETSSEDAADNFSVEVFDGAKVLQNSRNEPFDGQRKSSEIVIASSNQRDMLEDMCRDMMAAPGRKVPLEVSFVVASGNTMTADSLVYGENKDKLLVAGFDPYSNQNMVCIHEVLFITIALVWLLIQIIILVGCLVVIKRYRNFAEDQYRKDYHSFDNLGFDTSSTNRRVHWPDQNVDILHIN